MLSAEWLSTNNPNLLFKVVVDWDVEEYSAVLSACPTGMNEAYEAKLAKQFPAPENKPNLY